MRSGRTATLSGAAAEEIAARDYAREGGRVLARRWRCPEGEIDLVVEIRGVLAFVEVKARRSAAAAALALSAAQRRRLAAAAARYLAERGDGPVECRFDVVLVDGTGRAERLENAFGAEAD